MFGQGNHFALHSTVNVILSLQIIIRWSRTHKAHPSLSLLNQAATHMGLCGHFFLLYNIALTVEMVTLTRTYTHKHQDRRMWYSPDYPVIG